MNDELSVGKEQKMEFGESGTPEKHENEYLGHTLTPNGWREKRWRGGKEVEIDPLDLDPSPIQPLHRKFKDKHRQSLMAFLEAVEQVQSIDRKIPILREELISKANFDKQVIKDLVEFKLLEQHVIPISVGKKKLGGRAVLVPSLEARKLKRTVEEAMRDAGKEISLKESEAKIGYDGVSETPSENKVVRSASQLE